LPRPRANLELVNVVADEGTEAQFKHSLMFDESRARRNSQQEFGLYVASLAWDDSSRKAIPKPIKYSEQLLECGGSCESRYMDVYDGTVVFN